MLAYTSVWKNVCKINNMAHHFHVSMFCLWFRKQDIGLWIFPVLPSIKIDLCCESQSPIYSLNNQSKSINTRNNHTDIHTPNIYLSRISRLFSRINFSVRLIEFDMQPAKVSAINNMFDTIEHISTLQSVFVYIYIYISNIICNTRRANWIYEPTQCDQTVGSTIYMEGQRGCWGYLHCVSPNYEIQHTSRLVHPHIS